MDYDYKDPVLKRIHSRVLDDLAIFATPCQLETLSRFVHEELSFMLYKADNFNLVDFKFSEPLEAKKSRIRSQMTTMKS